MSNLSDWKKKNSTWQGNFEPNIFNSDKFLPFFATKSTIVIKSRHPNKFNDESDDSLSLSESKDIKEEQSERSKLEREGAKSENDFNWEQTQAEISLKAELERERESVSPKQRSKRYFMSWWKRFANQFGNVSALFNDQFERRRSEFVAIWYIENRYIWQSWSKLSEYQIDKVISLLIVCLKKKENAVSVSWEWQYLRKTKDFQWAVAILQLKFSDTNFDSLSPGEENVTLSNER